MSYSIKLTCYQTNPARGHFSIVEQTVFNYANGGTWSHSNGKLTLNMGGSGTSGTIRLMSDKGELILIAVGVDNHKRWCDVVAGLSPNETGVLINPQYYNNGGRDFMREKQLSEYHVKSAAGTKVEVKFNIAEGKDLAADIIIG